VTDRLESVERLSLRRRELLVLTSDGAGGEEDLHGVTSAAEPGEIGRRLVEAVSDERTDDATAVTIRLTSA
jgi:hypothetical protein